MRSRSECAWRSTLAKRKCAWGITTVQQSITVHGCGRPRMAGRCSFQPSLLTKLRLASHKWFRTAQ
jgi:hypothetical protein